MKRPRVRIVKGSVKNIKTGRIMVFTMPSESPANTAGINPSIRKPATKKSASTRARAFSKIMVIQFILTSHLCDYLAIYFYFMQVKDSCHNFHSYEKGIKISIDCSNIFYTNNAP